MAGRFTRPSAHACRMLDWCLQSDVICPIQDDRPTALINGAYKQTVPRNADAPGGIGCVWVAKCRCAVCPSWFHGRAAQVGVGDGLGPFCFLLLSSSLAPTPRPWYTSLRQGVDIPESFGRGVEDPACLVGADAVSQGRRVGASWKLSQISASDLCFGSLVWPPGSPDAFLAQEHWLHGKKEKENNGTSWPSGLGL